VTHRRSAPRTGYPFLDDPVDRGEVLAFAHRGGVLHPDVQGLENTMKAFEIAVGLGYRYLETDVHATRDGELLAFHDARLDRVTDRHGALSDLEYAEVATALVGGEEPIPRLADLLDAFPETCFNVDLKARSGSDQLVELIVRMGVQDRVLVGSFSERVLRGFRAGVRARSSKPVATSCGILGAAATAFVPLGRDLPGLLGDTGVALQVPHRFRDRVEIVDRAFVDRTHASGRHVHVWTIDDRAEIELMLDLGVDGIFTDRTDVLREVLVERGLWSR
jgi:glycerophosphoryl diester phosphodiesterase